VVIFVALLLWPVIAHSTIGLIYAIAFGIFFFVTHLVFVAHLRGSAVRLGPEQLPDLNQRVVELSARVGMEPPAAYLMQAGGTLNALATRFLGCDFIVLFSDLLEACGDNAAARDFIIAHELGHLRAGHLRWRWLLLPGLSVPFLGSAYSRACELTCDRLGFDASTDPQHALDGLCILAAGAHEGPRINRRALVAQRVDLKTGWMRIGRWLSTHPPIAERLAVLDPNLDPPPPTDPAPRFLAVALVALVFIVSLAAMAAMR
jgi:Zn-dependent protease with chaperone function